MALTITPTPLRVSKLATNPILKTFMLRSSLEKLRPLERFVLTMSPSSTSTGRSLSLSSRSTISEIVVLPEPESPVNHRVNPRSSFMHVPFDIPIVFTNVVYISLCALLTPRSWVRRGRARRGRLARHPRAPVHPRRGAGPWSRPSTPLVFHATPPACPRGQDSRPGCEPRWGRGRGRRAAPGGSHVRPTRERAAGPCSARRRCSEEQAWCDLQNALCTSSGGCARIALARRRRG